MAKEIMEKKKLFTGKMNLELKKRIMKCLVWSVALFAAETWTLTQTYKRLEAFAMWIWKKKKKISHRLGPLRGSSSPFWPFEPARVKPN